MCSNQLFWAFSRTFRRPSICVMAMIYVDNSARSVRVCMSLVACGGLFWSRKKIISCADHVFAVPLCATLDCCLVLLQSSGKAASTLGLSGCDIRFCTAKRKFPCVAEVHQFRRHDIRTIMDGICVRFATGVHAYTTRERRVLHFFSATTFRVGRIGAIVELTSVGHHQSQNCKSCALLVGVPKFETQ